MAGTERIDMWLGVVDMSSECLLDVTCLYVVRCTSRHPAPSGGTTASVGTCVELYYLREQRLYVCAPFVNE